jgi:hypothetical protein
MYAVQKAAASWPLLSWVLVKVVTVRACNTRALPLHQVKFWKSALAATQLALLAAGTAEETDKLALQIPNMNPKAAAEHPTSVLRHMP